MGVLPSLTPPAGTKIKIGPKKHLSLEKSFLDWVLKDNILDEDSIVVDWIEKNPLEHSNPDYAPVGNYMFTGIDEELKLIKRETT